MRALESRVWRLLGALLAFVIFFLSISIAGADFSCNCWSDITIPAVFIGCFAAVWLYRLLCSPIFGKWGVIGYIGCWLLVLAMLASILFELYW